MYSKKRTVIDHQVTRPKIKFDTLSVCYLSLKKVAPTCDTAKLIQPFKW